MEIFCPTCQKKLQLADTYAGQMVMCPSCTANFQAPSLAAQGASAAPIPFAPLPSAAPAIVAPSPEPARPTPSPSDLPPASPPPRGDYSHGITCTLRREVVALVAPIGTLLLFVISFFPWRHGEPSNLNLWELAFSSAGYTVFLLYVLLFILSVPLILAQPFLERKILPAPIGLRPYLPWVPTAAAFLTLITWLLFLTHYWRCTFVETWDPATLWMKLAFRLHFVIVVAAFLDYWLDGRKRLDLPEPSLNARW